MRLQVCQPKQGSQVFGGLAGEASWCSHACGQDITISKCFTYLSALFMMMVGLERRFSDGVAWPRVLRPRQHEYRTLVMAGQDQNSVYT